MIECKFCKKICKNNNSLRNHERLCKQNPNCQAHPKGNLGKPGWNKGLTKETDNRVKKNSESLKLSRKLNGSNWQGKKHSEETKRLMSIKACQRLVKNSKYSKNILYNGIMLESSYELMFAKQLDSFDIKWNKCYGLRFEYSDKQNKRRGYVPDFYLIDYNIYIDTKNDFLIKKDSFKISSVIEEHKINLYVLSLNDIKNEKILKLLPQ